MDDGGCGWGGRAEGELNDAGGRANTRLRGAGG